MAVLQPSTTRPLISSHTTYDRNWCRKQRRAHHKVKTGCKACKIRRQKCDEQRPTCTGCIRYSTECSYQNIACSRREKPPSLDTKLATKAPSSPLLAKGLSIPPSPELNLGDLELLHQYLTSTCIAAAQLPEVTAQIQITVPALAQEHPFVMHGILAMAATHLSRLRPSRQAHYVMIAAKNHDRAMPDFRSGLQNMNKDNCHALISYSKSLLWCSMARGDPSDQTENISPVGGGWLPFWFSLLRGSCCVVESSRAWITDGRHISQELDSAVDYSKSLDDHRISTLTSQLLLVAEPHLCETVVSALRESFARASMIHHNTPYRNAINCWVGSLPDKFIKLLQEKEPWALITLAHFCVLLHRSETVWFMKGHATRLLLSITEIIDASWKHFLEWPFEELGIA